MATIAELESEVGRQPDWQGETLDRDRLFSFVIGLNEDEDALMQKLRALGLIAQKGIDGTGNPVISAIEDCPF